MTVTANRPKDIALHSEIVDYWVKEKGATPWLSFRGANGLALAFNIHINSIPSADFKYELNIYGKNAGENIAHEKQGQAYHLEAENLLGTSWVGCDGFTLAQAQYLTQLVIDAFWDRRLPQYIEPSPALIADTASYSKLWQIIARFIHTESVRIREYQI